jgi:uncharacterized protein (TIGR02598 family)
MKSRRPPRRERAFSLVEVVIALAVVVLTMVPLIALLPVGLNVNKQSENESAAVNAMTAVINDRLSSPLTNASTIYGLAQLNPAMGVVTNSTLYLDEAYSPTNQAHALYQVRVVFTAPPLSALSPYQMYCQVSWPALAVAPQGWVETVFSISQTAP